MDDGEVMEDIGMLKLLGRQGLAHRCFGLWAKSSVTHGVRPSAGWLMVCWCFNRTVLSVAPPSPSSRETLAVDCSL